MAMMTMTMIEPLTHARLRELFVGYWECGTGGQYALVCSSARRIVFCTEEQVTFLRHSSCGGRACDQYNDPHQVFLLTPGPPAASRKVSASFKRLVEAEP